MSHDRQGMTIRRNTDLRGLPETNQGSWLPSHRCKASREITFTGSRRLPMT